MPSLHHHLHFEELPQAEAPAGFHQSSAQVCWTPGQACRPCLSDVHGGSISCPASLTLPASAFSSVLCWSCDFAVATSKY